MKLLFSFLVVVVLLAFQVETISILDQSKYCFSYPRTISLALSLSSGGSLLTNYYTIDGDTMVGAALSTPTKTGFGAMNGLIGHREVNVTEALNNLDVLLYNLQDESCEFYINSVTSTTVTFYKGINCITPNALNGALRIAFTNSILRFNATTETSESRAFIVKFPSNRAAEFDNATWDFIGTMDPRRDIVWVQWGANILMRQLNVLLPTQELYGIFIVPGFSYGVRVEEVTHQLHGGMFSVGNVLSYGNSVVVGDNEALFTECEPITRISWGENATNLSEIIFVATEIIRGTTISSGNNSVNVYGSYAQEFPYLSTNIYTNWYIQDHVYFPIDDMTHSLVKTQRTDIFNLLGRMPCDVRFYDKSTNVVDVITIYPGSTCLNHGLTSFRVGTVIFDGRNETNASFYVRSRGFETALNSGAFQLQYINGANSTRMYWTDSRNAALAWGTARFNVTLEGNFYFNNMTLSGTHVTVIGSLMAKYVYLNNAATLNVYPFPSGGESLMGDIYNVAP